MKKLLTLIFSLFIVSTVFGQASNDNIANAIRLCHGDGESGTTKNATVEAGDPTICGGAALDNVWFFVTAYQNGTNTVTVSGVTDADGFEVQIYRGSATNLTSIRNCKEITSASNYNLDGTTGDDTLKFTVEKDSSYYVMVDVKGASRGANAANSFSVKSENSVLGRPNAVLSFTDSKDSKCAGDTFFISNATSTLYGGTLSWTIENNETDDFVSWSGDDTIAIFYAPPADPFFEFGIRVVSAECAPYSSDSRPPIVLGMTIDMDTVAPVCVGTSVEFISEAELSDSDEPVNILDYIWKFEDGGVTSIDTVNTSNNPDTFIYTPLTDTLIVTLTAQSVECLDTSIVDTLIIGEQFNVNITPTSQQLCFGDVANILTAPQVVPGKAPFTYLWATSALAPDRTDSIGVKITGLGIGGPYEYTVRVTDDRGCLGFDTASITVPTPPSLDTAWVTALPISCTNDTGFCVGSDIVFNYTIAGGTAPYEVKLEMGTKVDSTISNSGANVNFTVTDLDSTETMILSITDNLGCMDTVVFVIPTQSLPTMVTPSVCISNNPPTGEICITNTCNNSTYVWSGLTSGLLEVSSNYDSCKTVDFTGQLAGTYTFNVTVTDSVTGCIDAISDSFSVANSLDIALVVNDTPICQTKCVDVELASPGGGVDLNTVTYSWTPAYADTNVYEDVCPIGDTTIYVSATKGSCTYVDSIEIEYVPTPAPIVTTVADSICECDSLTLTGTGSKASPTITYSWTSVMGKTIGFNDSIIAGVRMCSLDTFTFTITDNNGNCINSIKDTVKTISAPTAQADANLDSICLGAPTPIILLGVGSSNVVGVDTFSWTSNPPVTINNYNKINASATIDTMTTFYIVVRDTVLNCLSIDSIKVFTYKRTRLEVDPDFFCVGDPSKLSEINSFDYGAGSTFDWSESIDAAKITNVLDNDSVAKVDLNGVGVDTFYFRQIVDNARTLCKDTNDISIGVITSLTMTPNFNFDSTCYGDSMTITVLTPGADVWQWTSDLADGDLTNNGQDTTNTITVNPTPIGGVPTAYTYKLVSSIGVCTDSVLIELVTNPLPIPNVLDTAFCNGGTAVIANHSIISGDQFNWTPNLNLDSNTSANPTTSTTVSRDYALLYTDSNGCQARDTANITINSLPTIALASRTNMAHTGVCNGSGYCDNMYPIRMEYSTTGGTLPYTLTWVPNVDATNLNHGVPITTSKDTALVTSDTSIVYKAYITDANLCVDSANLSLVMINFDVSGTPLCETDNPPVSTFSVDQNCIGALFDWTPSGLIDSIITHLAPTESEAEVNFFGLDPETYSFAVSTNIAGCLDTSSFDFTIGSLFSGSFYPMTDPICNGLCDSLKISIAGDTTGASISLVELLSGDTIGKDLTVYEIEICPIVSQDYELIVEKNGCIDRDTISVPVVDPPVNTYGGEPDTVCDNSALLLDATGSSTVGVTYSWTSSTGKVISSDDEIIANIMITESDTFTLRIEDANCQVDSSRTVHVNLLPTMLADFSPDSICIGENSVVNLNGLGTAVGSQYVYEWTVTPSAVNIDEKDSVVTVATLNKASSIKFEIQDTTTSCLNDTTMILPTFIQALITGTSASFCMAEPVRSSTLSIENEGGGSTYDWSTSTDAIYITSLNTDEETLEVDVTSGGIGEYNFTCIVVNTRNNCDDTVNYTITVLNSPATVIEIDEDTICAGSFAELIVTGSLNYTWSMDPVNATLDGQENEDTINVSPTPDSIVLLQYTLKCIGNVGTCYDTVFQTVHVNPVIIIEAGQSQYICGSDTATIGGNPTGDIGLDFVWTPNSNISNTIIRNPRVYPNSSTTYYVTGTDQEACSNIDSVDVFVLNEPIFSFNRVTSDFVDCNDDIGYCSKDSIIVNYNITGGSGDYTITWDHTKYLTDNISGLFDGSSDVAYVIPDSTVEYIITISDNVSGCIVLDTQRFTILTPDVTMTDLCVIDDPQEATFCLADYCPGASFDWSQSSSVALLNNTIDSCVVGNFDGQVAGDYNFIVIVNDPIKSCIDTIPFTYTIEEPLITTLQTSHSSVCYGFPDTLEVVGDISGVDFTWVNVTTGDTLIDSTEIIIVYPTSDVIYSVTQYRGCLRTDQSLISVLPVPEIVVSVEDSSCHCDPIALDATGTLGGLQYQWTSTAGNVISNPTSLLGVYVNACVSDSITYRVTDPTNQCYTDTFVKIQEFPYPHASLIVGKDSICKGVIDAVSIDASGSTGINYTMRWDVSAGSVVNPNASSTEVLTDTFTIVTLTLTEKKSGCDSIIRDTIFLYELSSIGTEPDTVCAENIASAQICLDDFKPGSTFDWTLSGDIDLVEGTRSQSCITIPLDTVNPGLYYFGVAIFDPNSSCADTLYKNLRRLDSIGLKVTTDDNNDSLCQGESIQLSVSIADNHAWSVIPVDTSLTPDEDSSSVIHVTPTANAIDTVFKYTVIGQKYECRDTVTTSIFVKGSLSLELGPTQTVCEDSSIQYTNVIAQNGQVIWMDILLDGMDALGTFEPSINEENPNYVVKRYSTDRVLMIAELVDTFNICPNLKDSALLNIQGKPFMSFIQSDDTLCSLTKLYLEDVIIENDADFLWDDAQFNGHFFKGPTQAPYNAYIPNAVVTVAEQFLTGTVTGYPSCFSYDTTIQFFVYQSPIARLHLPDSVCFGESVAMNDTVAGGLGDIIQWTPGSLGGMVKTPIDSISNSYMNSTNVGFDTVTVTVFTDNILCADASATDVIEVKANPTISISSRIDEVCIGDPITFDVSGALNYKWYEINDEKDTLLVDSVALFERIPLITTTYMVVGKDYHSCSDTIIRDMLVKQSPEIDIEATYDDEQCYPMEVQFKYDKTNMKVESVYWDFKDGHGSSLDEPFHLFKKDPNIDYPYIYPVILKVTYGNKCVRYDTSTIIVCEDFEMPNVFTPDGDGKNDNFIIPGLSEMEGPCNFVVFDRWGETVYSSDNYQNQWVGENNVRKNHKSLNPDIYYYVFSCVGEVTWSGWVRIIATK